MRLMKIEGSLIATNRPVPRSPATTIAPFVEADDLGRALDVGERGGVAFVTTSSTPVAIGWSGARTVAIGAHR